MWLEQSSTFFTELTPNFRLSIELCPADFVSVLHLGSCYHVSATNLSHGSAREACLKIHPKSRLVSIDENRAWFYPVSLGAAIHSTRYVLVLFDSVRQNNRILQWGYVSHFLSQECMSVYVCVWWGEVKLCSGLVGRWNVFFFLPNHENHQVQLLTIIYRHYRHQWCQSVDTVYKDFKHFNLK